MGPIPWLIRRPFLPSTLANRQWLLLEPLADWWASSSRPRVLQLVCLLCGDYPFDTKFHDPKFMGIADFHYLIAPKDVVTRSGVPPQ